MQICSSYRWAVSQHQCNAALLRAKRAAQCSLLPCKTGSQLALCDCVCTYADMLFIHVCSEPAPMHCSAQGEIASLLFSAALQTSLTACACATVVTPMEICYSCRGEVMQHQCTAALVNAKCNPHCSGLLCKLASQHVLVPQQLHLWRFAPYRCAVLQHQCTAALVRAK